LFDARTLPLGTNFTLQIQGGDLDLLGEMTAIGGYEQIVDTATVIEVAGYQINFLSREHLIQIKRAAGLPNDLAVVPELAAILRAKQQQGTDPPSPSNL
jgi:hypothetical protein